MKKIILSLAAALVFAVSFSSCSKKANDAEQTMEESKTSQLVNEDKAYMDSISKSFMYFETVYTFAGNVDTLKTADIESVASVFETLDTDSLKSSVYVAKHYLANDVDSVAWEVKDSCYWIEDFDIKGFPCKLTVEQAFEALQKSPVKKPASRICVLRSQLVPKAKRPQYVFGDEKTGFVYVDAVSGEVTDVNPVFGSAKRISEID